MELDVNNSLHWKRALQEENLTAVFTHGCAMQQQQITQIILDVYNAASVLSLYL